MEISSADLLKDIEKFKETYYSENNKNFFFKKSQKMDCAAKISQKFDIEELLEKTVFVVPNTNHIYLDYNVFKLYANPDNYDIVVNRVIQLFYSCIETYGAFECHFNLNSFTITAAERYKQAIELFCKECLKRETKYGQKLSKMYIYYSPSMIDRIKVIFSKLIDPMLRDRFVIYSKEESDEKIRELFSE